MGDLNLLDKLKLDKYYKYILYISSIIYVGSLFFDLKKYQIL
jgi:hypothetical protein